MGRDYDFIFGVQYYRAPTPAAECWESDLKNMRANGFTSVKIWVQWRWTHRGENEFYFDDIDRLMDLAYENGLKVTLNTIFDVAPQWILKKYPDSKMVMANGDIVEPHVVGYRQIGGFPGTCYNHEAAFIERQKFLKTTVERYKNHPALYMWDVWNEPEQCSPSRTPREHSLTCFCSNCKREFEKYLEKKYGTIAALNDVWGRCYKNFEEIELPVQSFTYGDFIDFREFHLDTMTKEAVSRLRLVKEIDRVHPAYLHVVPNTSAIFNAITGVDDFELARECDVFASTNFAKPIWSIMTTSAGRGKVCYNVECHIGVGNTKMHQKQITLKDMGKDLIPQIGLGLRGFMFWQYRPEVLGHEAPAWGATKLDGTIGSVGLAAKEFIEGITPFIPEIMKAKAPKSEVAIWKGRKNEILNFCISKGLKAYAETIEAYVNGFYYNNYNCCVVDDNMIKDGLDDIKLLILPMCYEADRSLAEAVDRFVINGGTVLCEAHLGAYDADRGRHSYSMPGVGLDKLWGIKEEYTTSSYHLEAETNAGEADTTELIDDMKKALDAYGMAGGKVFKIHTDFGFDMYGAERFACLSAEDGVVVGKFADTPCIIMKQRGKGKIIYCGTNLGEAASFDVAAFEKFLVKTAELSKVQANLYGAQRGVHVDEISENIIVVNNGSDTDAHLSFPGQYQGIYFGKKTVDGKVCVTKDCAEIFVRV